MQKYCDHGGRYLMWLPFQVTDTHNYDVSIKPGSQGWPDNSSSEAAENITYYKSSQPLLMQDAWRQSSKKRQGQGAPYCVVATMGESRILYEDCDQVCGAGYEAEESWVEQECDLKQSVAGWEEAPCTACTLPSQVTKNIQFQMRGLCDRWVLILMKQAFKCQFSGLDLTDPTWLPTSPRAA